MKKMVMSVIFAVLIATVAVAQAEIKPGSFSVTPFVGGYFFEGNEAGYKGNLIFGVRGGYNFTSNLGLEGYLDYISTQDKDVHDDDVKIYGYGIEGLYHFMPQKRIVPFVALGVGGFHYGRASNEDYSRLTLDYGAGLKYFIKENIALRADVRHVLPINDRYNDLLATVGVTFAFGGTHKETVPAKVEEPPAPTVPEPVVEAPPAPKAPEVKVEAAPVPVPAPAPAPAPVPAPVVVEKPVITEKVIITLNIEFDTAKAVVKKKYEADIRKVADFMKAHPETNAVIEGHTDNVDRHHDPSRNIKLSQARADNVRKYLIEKFGIDEKRVSAVGYGPAKPIADNDTKDGRKKNRRIEAVIEAIEVK